MQLSSTLAIVLVVMALGLSCSRSRADMVNITVLDQNGSPIANALVLAPSGYLPPDQAASASQPPATMDQINKQFVPESLVIEQGRRVNFPNSDNIRHHVYSFSKPKVFELKLYAKQPEHPIPFNTAGIVVLGCNIHDHMIGYIVVSDTQSWQQTDAAGMANLDLPDRATSVRVWHPMLSSGFNEPEQHPLTTGENGTPVILTVNLKPPAKPAPQRGFGSDRFRKHGQ